MPLGQTINLAKGRTMTRGYSLAGITFFTIATIFLFPLNAVSLLAASPKEELATRGLRFTADVFVGRAAVGDLEAVKLFLGAGMNLDAKDCCFKKGSPQSFVPPQQYNRGKTALMSASKNGHLKVVLYLLEKGADIHARNNRYATALILAAEFGHVEIVQTLLANGADVNAHTTQGSTPLLIAAQTGSVGIAKVLLQHGANINLPNRSRGGGGATPLITASMFGQVKMVKFLLKNNADLNAQLEWGGETALDRANNPEIIRLLRAAGGKMASELR